MPKAKENKNFVSSFMDSLLKSSDNELASIMEEETLSTTTEFIDTGSYALNGLLVGNIFKGIPNNKTLAFAGEEGCGKTYLAIECMKHAIESGYIVAFFDSENAVDSDMLEKRGIDNKKVMYCPIATVEEFRDQSVKIVNHYNETSDDKKPKILIVLDSLGNLSTTKEMADVESGSNKKDMTRAQIIKSIFRVLNLKLAKAKIPMIITNHVYDQVGAFMPTKIMGGGSGLKYAASTIIYITKSKAKAKDGKTVVGIFMTCRTVKNRFCRPESRVKIYLDFDKGLNKYYGLQDYGEPMLKKEAKGWSIKGEKISEKDLWSKEWTPDLLEHIGTNIMNKISFGLSIDSTIDEIQEEEETKDKKGDK